MQVKSLCLDAMIVKRQRLSSVEMEQLSAIFLGIAYPQLVTPRLIVLGYDVLAMIWHLFVIRTVHIISMDTAALLPRNVFEFAIQYLSIQVLTPEASISSILRLTI